MTSLKISKTLSLPATAITETFAILAARGAGKSNTGAVMAEEMFKARLPFVVVDPVRAWWGLRSSRDGKGPGLPVPIFGGKHGDVPLERGGGQLIADLIVDQRLSCVLDISEFESEAAKKQFLLDFARRIYQRNEEPLHLFLEEADDYIPQKPMKDELQLLRAWENIVRRGRSRGLGMTMITQRSAVLNKNVLTQAQTLIAMRTTGPQDVAAIEAWLKYHQQGREILESLPSLEDGEAWVWSPRFLKKTVRVRFRMRETFDSGATPKMSKEARKPATLADVDLKLVKKKMEATIERAKAEDPRELRAQIAELKRLVKAAPVPVPLPKVAASKVEIKEVPVISEKDLKRFDACIDAFSRERHLLVKTTERIETAAVKTWNEISKFVGRFQHMRFEQLQAKKPVLPASRLSPIPRVPAKTPKTSSQEAPREREGLSDYALGLIQTMARRHPMQVTRGQLAVLSGRSIRSSAFSAAVAEILRAGVVRQSGTLFSLTDAGMSVSGGINSAPATPQEKQETWRRALPDYQRALFEVLLAAYPQAITREELAERAGKSITSSAFSGAIASLRKNGLADTADGGLKASDTLFD